MSFNKSMTIELTVDKNLLLPLVAQSVLRADWEGPLLPASDVLHFGGDTVL